MSLRFTAAWRRKASSQGRTLQSNTARPTAASKRCRSLRPTWSGERLPRSPPPEALRPPCAAKRATETIPIVFASGGDPVQLGLVSNFSRPDKNLTGLYFLFTDLVAKRLALLHELVPKAKRVAVLVNPANAAEAQPTVRNVTAAARELGLEVEVFNANLQSLDAAFADIVALASRCLASSVPIPRSAASSRRFVDFQSAPCSCRRRTSFAILSRPVA